MDTMSTKRPTTVPGRLFRSGLLVIALALAACVVWAGSTQTTRAAAPAIVSSAPQQNPPQHGTFTLGAVQAPGHNSGSQPNVSPLLPVSFLLDDNYADTSIGWNYSSSDRSSASIFLNRFTPTNVNYPLTLNRISILWPGQGGGPLLGREIRLLVYFDADGDGNPANATLIYQLVQTIAVADWTTWQDYPVNILVGAPGDIYVGFENKYGESAPSPRTYPGALDTTTSRVRSWLAAQYNSNVPNIANLGGNDYLGLVDSAGFPGNWMIRAYGNDALVLTSTPTATPTPRCPGERFSDVCPSDFFYAAVTYLSNLNVISGYSDGTFRPYNNTTRSQLAKIITLAEAWPINTSGGPHFSDVPTSNPFYNFVETAYNHGVIAGYSDGTFRPFNDVTRGQLSKIIVLSEGWTINTSGGPHFTDVPVSNPFYTFVETAYNHAVIAGYSDGTFRPGNNATRGQISVIIYRAIQQRTPTPTSTVPATTTATMTVTETPVLTMTPSVTVTVTETPTTFSVR